jgi:hypothetical protein
MVPLSGCDAYGGSAASVERNLAMDCFSDFDVGAFLLLALLVNTRTVVVAGTGLPEQLTLPGNPRATHGRAL